MSRKKNHLARGYTKIPRRIRREAGSDELVKEVVKNRRAEKGRKTLVDAAKRAIFGKKRRR